jgi:restriction system protein
VAGPIEDEEPATWEELEVRVARILNEAGLRAERGKSLRTARGAVAVDVCAVDESVSPNILSLFECKHWKRAVPQAVVHAFRTVVSDSGAHQGLIVSRSGFQSGADSSSDFSNVSLVDWADFQALYAERWYRHYMKKQGWTAIDPLVEYTEPINNRIFRKADRLSHLARERFIELRRKHGVSTMILAIMFLESEMVPIRGGPPPLPLREAILASEQSPVFPDVILDATSLRGLLDAIVEYSNSAVAEFDAVFGERA